MKNSNVVPFVARSSRKRVPSSTDLPDPAEGRELIELFIRIRDPKLRAAVNEMAAALVESAERGEDSTS